MKNKPYTFDRVIRLLIGIAILTAIFWFVNRLSNVLFPFLLAWLLAYLLNPIVAFFQYKLRLRSRVLSIITTLVLGVAIITGMVMILTPMISAEIQKLSQLVTTYSNDINIYAFIPYGWQHEVQHFISRLDIQSLLQNDNVMSFIKKIMPQLWNFLSGSLSFLLGFAVLIVIFLYMIFILMDYDKLSEGWINLIPPKYRNLITEILHDVENGMNRYFRGQALVAIFVAILFSIGFSIIGLPLSIVLGLLIGLLSMVPYLQALGIIPALVLALLRSAETGQSYGSVLLAVALVFLIVQIIEDLILTPRIMGKVTGLHPAVILLALSIWGSLLGFVGLIIALPLTTIIISYYKRYVITEDEDENL